MSLAQATPHRLAVAALLTALALAACGRKGPLELPPGTPPDPVTRGLDATHLSSPAPPAPATATAAVQTTPQPLVEDPSLVQPPNKSYQVPASTQLNQAVASPAAPPINRPPSDPKTGKQFVLDPLL